MAQRATNPLKSFDLIGDDIVNDLTELYSLVGGGGGSQTLSETLANGNETDGNNIKLTGGDRIFNDDRADLISGLELDPANIINGTILFTQDTASGNATKIDVASVYGTFTSFDSNFENYQTGLETNFDSFGNKASVGLFSSNLAGESIAKIELSADLTNDVSKVLISADIIQLNLPKYADNAAAVSGGHPVGGVYKTATGELRIVV